MELEGFILGAAGPVSERETGEHLCSSLVLSLLENEGNEDEGWGKLIL